MNVRKKVKLSTSVNRKRKQEKALVGVNCNIISSPVPFHCCLYEMTSKLS